MKKNNWFIIKGLITKNKKESFLKFLPPIEIDIYNKQPETDLTTTPINDLIDYIHYSWPLSIIKNFSENEKKYFISILNKSSSSRINKILDLEKIEIKLSIIFKKFLKNYLLLSLLETKKDLLPIDFLPKSKMNALLKLTKNKLIEVIDLLSLYDLSEEMKKIVDTNLLKKIKDALPQNKLKILHQISNRPHPFKPQRIGLEKWNGKIETLNKILHKKGLIRLSFALYQEDKSLIWYICHLLDIGRGAALSKLCKNEKNEKISNQISQDVLELINIQQKEKL